MVSKISLFQTLQHYHMKLFKFCRSAILQFVETLSTSYFAVVLREQIRKYKEVFVQAVGQVFFIT